MRGLHARCGAGPRAAWRRREHLCLLQLVPLVPAGRPADLANSAPLWPPLPADGACTRCSLSTHVLVPQNAIYINVAGQGSQVGRRRRSALRPERLPLPGIRRAGNTSRSALLRKPAPPTLPPFRPPPAQCMTAAQVAAEALAITSQTVTLPAGCAEVDTEFKCNRCQDVSPAAGRCTAGARGAAPGRRMRRTLRGSLQAGSAGAAAAGGTCRERAAPPRPSRRRARA